ncbi:8-amino-7-oxononanoate synthase [Candidatus Magnetaquicoccaceae bacterium FCR-1]|uniref:8-amino-7-oxononanoate synthase n=1 Tax=Candidatus Magnetaquiglobus chichijimensis TaxID=3141448 RepID=A0ABQ0C4B0_9PROT
MPARAYAAFLAQCARAGQTRRLVPMLPASGGRIDKAGQRLINFSSNNYMGLADHPLLIERARDWTARWGCSASASRLVCGNLEPFEQVEARLAAGKGSGAALVFNAGFQANATLLAALLDRQVLGGEPLVFCDRLNHASLHHGCLAAGVRQIRYRHNDLNHLEELLDKQARHPGPRFIVTESLFSMDGDPVDLPGLIALKDRFGAFLFLDEAHATGVFGPGGFGLAAAHPGAVELVMGTFSKGLGGFGAYVACSPALRDYLVQRCAGLIYSTALPPAVLGAMDAALELLPTLDETRQALLERAAWLRRELQGLGLDTGRSASQIIPVLLGESGVALEASRRLEVEHGILAMAIRPPTVPKGTARLRVSLSAAHGTGDLIRLLDGLRHAEPRHPPLLQSAPTPKTEPPGLCLRT